MPTPKEWHDHAAKAIESEQQRTPREVNPDPPIKGYWQIRGNIRPDQVRQIRDYLDANPTGFEPRDTLVVDGIELVWHEVAVVSDAADLAEARALLVRIEQAWGMRYVKPEWMEELGHAVDAARELLYARTDYKGER